VRSIAAPNRCTWPTGQVCPLVTLANIQFTLKIMIYFSRMSFMYLVHLKICFLFISPHMIIMPSLKFILGIFFLRIETRANRFFTKDVVMTFILYLLQPCPSKELIKVSWPPSNRLWQDGIIVFGHASSPIVQHVLSGNNLSFSKETLDESMCDACQMAKSHQLPFPKFVSVSKTPLELIFSNV
jgi:hypothetical protein